MAVKTPPTERAEGRRKQAAKGNALPDGSFPIPNVEYLKKAIQAFGRADDAKKARVKAHIKSRARALGREDLIPSAWKDGSTKLSYEMARSHSSRIHPGLDRKPGESNWVDQEGGLPNYIERIAKHIHSDSGLSISHSIAAAVERVKKLAAKGNPKAIAALAQWQRKRASARARPNKGGRRRIGLARDDKEKERKRSVESKTNKNETDDDRRRQNKRKSASAQAGQAGIRSTVAGRHVRTKNRQAAQLGPSKFDESKIVRDQGGRFGEKIDAAQYQTARRIVSAAVSQLQVGASVKFPGGIGWVQRTEAGYMIQGENGRVVVRTVSEAIEAAASVLAPRVQSGVK